MNTDTGHFETVEEAPKWATHIRVGERVTLKGEQCKVTEINDRHITLELLSAEDRGEMNRHERMKARSKRNRARRREG